MMTKKITKADCSGCHNDFYNHGGVTGQTNHCWFFNEAEMTKRKEVHINDLPPWKHRAQLRPNCYRKPQYVYVNANTTC